MTYQIIQLYIFNVQLSLLIQKYIVIEKTKYIQLQFCIGKMPSNSQCPNNKADKKYGSYFVTSITRISNIILLLILGEHHTGLVSLVVEVEVWETLMELQVWDSCSQPPQLETLQPLQVLEEVVVGGCRVW